MNAVTIATTHDGKDALISGMTVPVHVQYANLRKLLVLKEHPEFSTVTYQVIGAEETRTLRFTKPVVTAPQPKHRRD